MHVRSEQHQNKDQLVNNSRQRQFDQTSFKKGECHTAIELGFVRTELCRDDSLQLK